jgi:UDP-galactopyranose mutase
VPVVYAFLDLRPTMMKEQIAIDYVKLYRMLVNVFVANDRALAMFQLMAVDKVLCTTATVMIVAKDTTVSIVKFDDVLIEYLDKDHHQKVLDKIYHVTMIDQYFDYNVGNRQESLETVFVRVESTPILATAVLNYRIHVDRVRSLPMDRRNPIRTLMMPIEVVNSLNIDVD